MNTERASRIIKRNKKIKLLKRKIRLYVEYFDLIEMINKEIRKSTKHKIEIGAGSYYSGKTVRRVCGYFISKGFKVRSKYEYLGNRIFLEV